VKNIPVLHFFTGQHKYYHKPSDDAVHINFEGIVKVSDYMLSLMRKADGRKMTFTKSKDAQEKKGAAFKVTLGVMPDYVYTGKGMRVDSVIEGRVGDKGGVKDGDIIIKIGDVVVGDIYDYMEGLAKFEKGQSAEVVVLRKKKKKDVKKTLKVTFE
ncbi:MAG TPA: PDZ domain-containing protein, partial [Phaeodactylibacter sp.]|nr:PDZ domain-containing protein [Phaeodactylibacter sp.]